MRRAHWFIALHGGAAQGYMSQKHVLRYQKSLALACSRAALLLRNGSDAVEAVKEAIKARTAVLTRVGFGSNLNIDGFVECDASVMEGGLGGFGAVGAAPGIKNPIVAAVEIMKD
ncbi:hypothetical protein GUITHDRAFT_120370, partial [Guillardia theta CCMP2712]